MYTVAPYRNEICLEVMRGPKESGFKDFRNHPTGKVKLGEYEMSLASLQIDPEGPGYDEWVVRRNQQQKNNHLR